MQGLVAYKPLVYKPTPTPPSKPIWQVPGYLLVPRPNWLLTSPSKYRQTPFKIYLLQESDQKGLSGFGTVESWGLKFSGIGQFGIIWSWWRVGQNLSGMGVNIEKYWMIWHGITLLLSLKLYYYYIYVNVLLYFEIEEKFCCCIWLQICSTFCNLIYCSFVRFCDQILSLYCRVFPTGGGRMGGVPPPPAEKWLFVLI